MARVHVGICSWSESADFYPPGLPSNHQITFYAERFTLVELDSSFYRLMPLRNFKLWAERTPDGFLFDVKPFRVLSWHDRDTPPNAPTFDEFRASLQPLRDAGKLGVVNFKFPPWFRYEAVNLAYIEQLQDIFLNDFVAVEFRHNSWMEAGNRKLVLAALRKAKIAYIVVDEPQVGSGSVPTVLEVTLPEMAVIRLHGRNGSKWYARVAQSSERFDYLYSQEELGEWIPRLEELAREARNIHVLFNNNWHNYSITNAVQLRRMIQRAARPELEVAAPAIDEEYSAKEWPNGPAAPSSQS